jgi:hypothetical protein
VRTLFALTVLEQLEGTKGSSAGEHLVAQLGFVLVIVDLLISIMRVL